MSSVKSKAIGELPQRTSTYVGRFTDTNHWDSFRVRPDDILICTPPKCGTTWTQAICALLIFRTANFTGKLADISPWVDGNLESQAVCLATLEAQTHRRFVKTHTPLDGMPYFPSCEYLIVYRDPRDAYFSHRNQLLNMIDPPDVPYLKADPQEGFRIWLDTPFEPEVADQRSLEAFIQHFNSFGKFRSLGNFHFLHYADLKRDLPGCMSRIAGILKIQSTDEELEELCHAASFAEMKKKASSFAPASGKSVLKNDKAFFSSGQNTQWRKVLGAPEIDNYNKRINELISPAERNWIENGDGG